MAVLGRSALVECDIIVSQGATNEYSFRYATDDGTATPVDLTSWSARAQLRHKVGGEVWLSLTDEDGITLGADGLVSILIEPAATEVPAWNGYAKLRAGVPVPSGVWDLELESPTGYVVRLVEGVVTVAPDVTRDLS